MQINDNDMTSDQSPHTARRTPWQAYEWEVSWLPGRRFTRNEAITAMTLAETSNTADPTEQTRLQPFIRSWAEELGLTADQARTQTAAKPAWTLTPQAEPDKPDPEAGQ